MAPPIWVPNWLLWPEFILSFLFIIFIAQIPSSKNSLPMVFASSPAPSADDLISARCQSKCLYELEQRHKNNSEARHMLRHQISTLCKEDVLCASCIAPCRDMLIEDGGERCIRTSCTASSVDEPSQCRQSCAFLAQIAANKPGQCPVQKNQKNVDSECSAFCDSDIDCPEAEKCCSIGCSRTCLSPVLNDSRLLPRPDGISVQERKRKRSAILRWIMKRLMPKHTATNSNLFVIQWRWSVHKQPETMAPWQTVMVRNKMYAILKHLLVPGRFYLFRVAAVNMHGTYGFSAPSHPAFKLSKEVKAPSAPGNLSILSTQFDGIGGMAKIGWAPPDSELPIKEYHLSWWKSTPGYARAFALRQTRNSKMAGAAATAMDEDYDNDEDVYENKKTLKLPSYGTKAELSGLEAGQVYLIELYATVESNQGELRSDPAILFVSIDDQKSNISTMATTTTMTAQTLRRTMLTDSGDAQRQINNEIEEFADDGATNGLFIAELKTPFFEGGRLKTILSWLEHPNCKGQQQQKTPSVFRVIIRSIRCLNQLPPQQFTVRGCVATLENLQFRCEYFVRVEKASLPNDGNKKQQKELIARLTFATLPCEQSPSDVPLECDGNGGTEDMAEAPAQSEAKAQPLLGATERTTTKTMAKNNEAKTTSTTTTAKTITPKKDGGARKAKKNALEGDEDEWWLPIEEVEKEEEEKEEEEEEDDEDEEKDGDEQTKKPKQNKAKERGTRTKEQIGSANNKKQQQQQSRPNQSHLSCFATSSDTAECLWTWPQSYGGQTERNPLIGFRTMLASTLAGVPPNVTIVGAEQRRMHLTGLKPSAVYRFRLQAITTLGLGTELDEHFSTNKIASSAIPERTENGEANFPEISNFPWEASAAFNSRTLTRSPIGILGLSVIFGMFLLSFTFSSSILLLFFSPHPL